MLSERMAPHYRPPRQSLRNEGDQTVLEASARRTLRNVSDEKAVRKCNPDALVIRVSRLRKRCTALSDGHVNPGSRVEQTSNDRGEEARQNWRISRRLCICGESRDCTRGKS